MNNRTFIILAAIILGSHISPASWLLIVFEVFILLMAAAMDGNEMKKNRRDNE